MAGVVGSNPTRPTTNTVLFMDSIYISETNIISYQIAKTVKQRKGQNKDERKTTTMADHDPMSVFRYALKSRRKPTSVPQTIQSFLRLSWS